MNAGASRTGTAVAADTRLERLAAIAGEVDYRELVAEALSERQRLLDARFFVACVGQFKRGKSTLLNALVGESLLPVGVIPVTSVVTILAYRDTPMATVRFSSGQSEGIRLETIGDFVDERRNPGNTRGVAVVEVGFPATILRDGLCLVDTPGLGSVHTTNTEATRAFVPHIDVALIVVGPDPPISGAELELVRHAAREAGELALILNKADQVSPEHLRESEEFTRTIVASATHRSLGGVFVISALERLTTERPTRDWSALESYLRQLATTARERLVGQSGERAVTRLVRRVAHELTRREDALRRPLAEIEDRVARLRQATTDLDQALIELRLRFDAAEADLGKQFEQRRTQFIERTGQMGQALLTWIDAHPSSGRALRSQAFEEARRLATTAVQDWFDDIEPEANARYQAVTERFVRTANDYIARVAADAADLDADQLPAEIGLRARRQFYFTHLMHTTGGTPVTWLIDRVAPRRMRQAHVARAASAYLAHLLDSNSHRVENDFRDRTRESRRWLEGQIRRRLASVLQSAERAHAVAVDKQHMSEDDIGTTLRRIEERRAEVLTFSR